ncbi:transposase [Streptomyces swartbergensis]|uniref:transposase n=1 Tax=Streptomyces swartbergensis TaxID=487165 RepID=UPI001FC9960D|nr:transposase [Streptomyces swartbergensis]
MRAAAASVPASTRGYDGGKKVPGRKRHVITDCLGLLLAVAVTPANTGDHEAAMPPLGAGAHRAPCDPPGLGGRWLHGHARRLGP